jgi:isoleucyl-tRNA synthetase
MNKLIQAIKDKKKEDYEPITPPSDDTIVGREFNLSEELEVDNTFDITIEERIIPTSYISEIYLDGPEIQEVIECIQEEDIDKIEENLIKNYNNLRFHQKWILSRIKYLSDLVTDAMEKYDFSQAGIELQAFTKNEFCDYYIEEFKLTKEKSEFGNDVITYTLNKLLKLWHPYIPFVSEEIYNKLGFQ